MADSVAGKRITEFTEASSIGTGDFIAVDNASQDTKKYDATKLATKEYADDAVSNAIDNLTIPTAKIEDGAVTTAKIADANVTTAKIANSAVNESKIADSAVTSNKINNGAVATAKIADGAVNTDKLGAGAVTSAKLGAYSVTNTKIAENAVRNEHITDGAITRGKLASDAVTEAKIYEGAVTTDKLGASAVTTAKISDSAVTTDKINNGAVTTGKLADGAVSTAKIADSAVTEGKIGANAVTNAKIANNAVNADKIANSAVTTDKINNNAVTTAKINDGAVTEGKLGSNAVTTAKINDGAITENKIADGAVTEDKLGEDVAEILDNKAEIDGYYEDLTSGSSEQLLSNTYIPDNTPYLFRTSGGSLEIGNRVFEDAIVGGSVAWNQLVQNGNFENTSGWNYPSGTFSVSNNIGTFIPTEQGQQITRTIGYKLHHKYLCSIDIKLTTATESVFLRVIGSNKNHTMATTDWQNVAAIVNSGANSANSFGVRDDRASGWDAIQMRNAQIFDLTLAFGSAMADYIYSLEQATAGSGIAWLKSQGFFIKDYYAYNAGSIKSVQTSAKKVVGFNQFDEVMELGSINSSGQPVSSNNNIRAKNYIRVTPSTSYYFNSVSGSSGSKYGFLYFYDGEKNFISSWNNEAHIYKNVFTTPSNCQYIRFVMSSNYGTTYNNDICINLHWDGERDGEYEPYVEHTYPLDNDLELRGIPKLDSSNKLYYDGDLYASDGTITRRYGIVDLGTLNWSRLTTGVEGQYRFTTSGIASTIKTIASNKVANIITAKYVTVKGDTGWATEIDKVIWVDYTGSVNIIDKSYTDKDTFKTAMSGVYLVYELTTPTTESADPYQNPQIVSNWGTEEFVDERTVPVPVGHDSRYLPDLKAKLESAPNNPSTNGKYFLQYQNGEATYVPVPSEVPQTPSEDGTYILKATVSSGVATLAWVAEE